MKKKHLKRFLQYAEDNGAFSSLSMVIKEITGVEHAAIAVLDSLDDNVMIIHPTEIEVDDRRNFNLSIPISSIETAIEKNKTFLLKKQKTTEHDFVIDSLSEFEKVMLIPAVGNRIQTCAIAGTTNGNLDLSSKKIVESVKHLLVSSEWFILFLANYARIKDMTLKDDLTKAYNRRFLEKELMEEINRAKRNDSNLAFIFFDLNDFKSVNEEYGHYYGSQLLRYIAKLLMENIREMDKLVRYGGDEFCVILPDTDIGGAKVVAMRIHQFFEEINYIGPDNGNIRISACFGIASYPHHATNVRDLICAADQAMFMAKKDKLPIQVVGEYKRKAKGQYDRR